MYPRAKVQAKSKSNLCTVVASCLHGHYVDWEGGEVRRADIRANGNFSRDNFHIALAGQRRWKPVTEKPEPHSKQDVSKYDLRAERSSRGKARDLLDKVGDPVT